MSVTIRKAMPEDAARISLLSGQLDYAPTIEETLHSLEQLLAGGDLMLVAEADEMVVGWMQVTDTIRLESGRFGEIAGLVVEEAFRGQGIGRLLVDAAKDWCRERGIPLLKVRSNTKRSRAHQFYREAGFTEVKEQKVFEWKI